MEFLGHPRHVSTTYQTFRNGQRPRRHHERMGKPTKGSLYPVICRQQVLQYRRQNPREMSFHAEENAQIAENGYTQVPIATPNPVGLGSYSEGTDWLSHCL